MPTRCASVAGQRVAPTSGGPFQRTRALCLSRAMAALVRSCWRFTLACSAAVRWPPLAAGLWQPRG